MDHAVVAVATRQQRRRPVRPEPLPGRAIRRPRQAHAPDHEHLPVIMSVHADAERIAHAARGAIGRDQQARVDRAFPIVADDQHPPALAVDARAADEPRRPVP